MSEDLTCAVSEQDGDLVPLPDNPTQDERAYAAHQLRLGGLTWTEVATKAGYANAATANVEVKAFLQRAALMRDYALRQESLDMEMDRLDALQAAAWGAAMTGDLKAIDTCIRVMGHRAKLLGLEYREETVVNRTIVVTGSTEQYVQTLKMIAGTDE
jgi:hypothetical protein